MAFALVSVALTIGQPSVAAAILLCFSGLLRISEALSLTWDSLVFIDDAVVLILGRTKRGIDQKVVLTHKAVVRWLCTFHSLYCGKPSSRVCDASYSKFRYWLPRLCKALHVADLDLTSHSFRRGGASTLLHQGMPVADIAVHGRWASERSCREYLRRGEVFMLRLQSQFSKAVWSNIVLLSKSMQILLECN